MFFFCFLVCLEYLSLITLMKCSNGHAVAPHAVMHHLHDFIAGHVSHGALTVQHSVGPVASVFGPSEHMRVVVSETAVQVHRGLEDALAMLGSAFVDMARVHAAVLAVNGHGGLRLGIGGGHRGGGPVVIVSLSLRLHRCRS